MKKVLALILALVLALSLVACGKSNDAEAADDENEAPENVVEGGNVVNPWKEYDSLEEINEVTHGNLCSPAAMGAEGTYYAVMNDGEMAEYRFTMNGMDYCFRFAPAMTEDISGVYVGEGTAFPDEYGGDVDVASTDNMKLARWMTIDGQYVLMVTDDGAMENDTFLGIAGEMKAQTEMDMPNANGENG